MKNLLLLLLSAVGIICTACENSDEIADVNESPFVPEITISPQKLSFSAMGGTQEVAITTNFEYEISENASWLSATKTKNGITIIAETSDITTMRSAEITILNEQYSVSKVVTITQAGFVPEIAIAPESLSFTVDGGTQEVTITANFEYEISENASWLSVTKTQNGITVVAEVSDADSSRSTKITIQNEKYNISKVITVTQAGFVPEIIVNPESLSFTSDGGLKFIQITSNIEYAVSINADIWISIVDSENRISVYAAENETTQTRKAEIVVYNTEYDIAKTIFVEQMGVSASLIISPETLNFPSYGGSQRISITANCEYELEENADWIDLNQSIFDNSITITAAANTSNQKRTAEIRVVCKEYNIKKTILVTQEAETAPEAVIIVNPTQLYFTSDGGVQEISITANCEYEIKEEADWLAVSMVQSGGAQVSVNANNYIQNRQAEIVISDLKNSLTQIVKVMQAGVSSDNNVIMYTSNLNQVVTPLFDNVFGARIISNTWDPYLQKGIIVFDGAVTEIGDSAFSNKSELTSIEIPNSVTFIGDRAFKGCTSLTSITIGDNVKSIGTEAFYKCTSLISATISDVVGVTTIGVRAFSDCSSLKDFTIPDRVTSIGEAAFDGCSSLTSVNIPFGSITSIEANTFARCFLLQQVDIPSTVKSIGRGAFRECTSLKNINMVDGGVTSIGEEAFSKCTSLTSVVIPSSVKSIGESVFFACTSLRTVYCKPTTPPNAGKLMFYYWTDWPNYTYELIGCTIYVPRIWVWDYKAATYWSEYANYIVGYDF